MTPPSPPAHGSGQGPDQRAEHGADRDTHDRDPQDRELLAAHVAGDRDAFGSLVAAHRDRLWAVALRTLGDREEAADALQDALLSAYRGASSYRGEARVTTWLHRIVVNACLDRVRRRQARRTVALPDDLVLADPADPLGAREDRVELERALAALPPEQRAAVVLVDVQGLPLEEAAHVLGIPLGTVKSRCSRGRARLALALGHLRNLPADAGVSPGSSRSTSSEVVPPTQGQERSAP